MSYEADRQWGDAYLPAVRQIVGPHMLVPAPFENDVKEATDLMVLKALDFRIAVRVRRPGYALRFGNQFTIRYDRPTGARTEYEKIMEGFGDWMLYGHASADQPGELARWMLLDLSVFRCWAALHPVCPITNNCDGVSFLAFDVRGQFPAEIIIAESEVRHELAT